MLYFAHKLHRIFLKIFIASFVLTIFYLNLHISAYQSIPDFSQWKNKNIRQKKFRDYLLPMVERENEKLYLKRKRIIFLYKKFKTLHQLSPDEFIFLNEQYGYLINFDPYSLAGWQRMLKRVNVVPTKVVLQQFLNAANHASLVARFNFLRMPCYKRSCNMSSIENSRYRSGGETVNTYVGRLFPLLGSIKLGYARYGDLQSAIMDYVWLLNVHPAFHLFRELREKGYGVNSQLTKQEREILMRLTDLNRIKVAAYYEH